MKKRNDPSEIRRKSPGGLGAYRETTSDVQKEETDRNIHYVVYDMVTNEWITKKSDFKIDTSLIPEHVKEELAAATFESVRRILEQPGGREMLDAKAAERKARLASK